MVVEQKCSIWEKMVKRNHAFQRGGGKVIMWELDMRMALMDRIYEVINCIPIRVIIKSKLTNLMKISRIEGYNGKYGSNPQRIRKISDDLFEFDQIGR